MYHDSYDVAYIFGNEKGLVFRIFSYDAYVLYACFFLFILILSLATFSTLFFAIYLYVIAVSEVDEFTHSILLKMSVRLT